MKRIKAFALESYKMSRNVDMVDKLLKFNPSIQFITALGKQHFINPEYLLIPCRLHLFSGKRLELLANTPAECSELTGIAVLFSELCH